MPDSNQWMRLWTILIKVKEKWIEITGALKHVCLSCLRGLKVVGRVYFAPKYFSRKWKVLVEGNTSLHVSKMQYSTTSLHWQAAGKITTYCTCFLDRKNSRSITAYYICKHYLKRQVIQRQNSDRKNILHYITELLVDIWAHLSFPIPNMVPGTVEDYKRELIV